MIRKCPRLFVTVLSLALLSCISSPTGRNQLMLISADKAIFASKDAYREIMDGASEDGTLDNNPALVKRVRTITGRIIAQAIKKFPHTKNWDWTIRVIDDEQVNAWCMAGGKMAIYTGLIDEISPTDDELAQVLGHEVAHALANHTAERMSIALATSVGLLGLSLALGNDSSTALGGLALAATLAIEMPNSRASETEADEIGIELAARAGYNPRAAVTLWQKMGQMKQEEGYRTPEWLSTHPSPANRQQKLASLAGGMMRYYREDIERPVYQLPL